MEFLNNIWIALSTENTNLVNGILVISSFIEFSLIISLFLSILATNILKRKKILCIVISAIIGFTLNLLCPSPYNIFISYAIIYLVILFILKLHPLSALLGLLVPVVAFTLAGSLILNPFFKLLNLSYMQVQDIPIYRLLYLSNKKTKILYHIY